MKPQRVQRRRTKGWRMPENTVYVGRGSVWGNPFKVGENFEIYESRGWASVRVLTLGALHAADAVTLYRIWLTNHHIRDVSHPGNTQAREFLAGKNLACWCPLDQPCHADVLLEIANGPAA